MPDRIFVPGIMDAIKRHIAEPARGIGRIRLEPTPVLVVVYVWLAIRFDDIGGGHEHIVQAPEMNRRPHPKALRLFNQPLRVPVVRRSIEPVWIIDRREDC